MKPQFTFVELSGPEASAAPMEKLADLQPIRACKNIAQLDDCAAPNVTKRKFKNVAELAEATELGNFVVIYGQTRESELIDCCKRLKQSGAWPIIATDAINSPDDLLSIGSKLETDLVQMMTSAAVLILVKSERSFIYPYEKSDCTASICLLFDGGLEALAIERLHDPHAGKLAFPGGFLRVFLETIEDCAYRELQEECGIKLLPGELALVDLRSAPDRDPRSHIMDAGYAALVSNRRKNELLPQLQAGDDASKAQLFPVTQLLRDGELAFDHRILLINSLKHFNLVRSTD
jgi:ADP-ribose pyrophosphatase YjhB (NUDIX family)